MRLRSFTLFVLALPIAAQERSYRFINPPSVRACQELLTVIRTVTDAQKVSAGQDCSQVEFGGRADSPEMSEWVLQQLDKPAGTPVWANFHPSASSGGDVRVIALTHVTSDQGTQEVLTILRTVADVQKVFSYSPLHALTLRGPAQQLAMSEWLIKTLDQPDGKAMQELSVPGEANDFLRVYRLSGAKSPQDLQNITVALRTTGGIKRVFSSRAVDAIALRGTSDQITNADAIIVSMDKQLAH